MEIPTGLHGATSSTPLSQTVLYLVKGSERLRLLPTMPLTFTGNCESLLEYDGSFLEANVSSFIVDIMKVVFQVSTSGTSTMGLPV